jgi:death-on-curing protein
MNHGFVDDNKRVGLACTYVFLEANGTRITADPEDLLAFIIHHLETGTFTKDNVDTWLRANSKAA